MDGSKSISQGAFLSLPPGFNLSKLRRRKKRKADDERELADAWESAFLKIWTSVETELKEMNEKLYSKVLEELIKHIEKIGKADRVEGSIPCDLLLTGTNLPDHKMLLDALTRDLSSAVTPHVATLWAGDAANIKSAIQNIVKQIVDCSKYDPDLSDVSDDDSFEEREDRLRLQAGQLSLSTLAAWYADNKSEERSPVVIIIPDFESFSSAVLSDLIALLCGYEEQVPFILVMGVATSPSAVYQSLPRATLSRLVIQLFHSEASTSVLNHVVEKILLNDKCPFRMGARTMTFLTDVFLFHSFSVHRFVQGFKYCMMEHFYMKDHMSLCCTEQDIDSAIQDISSESVENLRRLPSFRAHVEASDLSERKLLLLNDKYTRKFVGEQLKTLHSHVSDFHIVLKCLNILTRDLPGAPLGRHVREVYCRAVSSIITQDKDFQQAISLLGMQAKSELTVKVVGVLDLLKIDSILDILCEEQNRFEAVIVKLENLKKELDRSGNEAPPQTNGDANQKDIRKDLVKTLVSDLLTPFLVPPTSLTLNELLYFDDLQAVRRRISGAPRSAIHTALNNPQVYLECDCCELPMLDAVLPSLPDLSVVYKLYLESNKTINMFDWLQSFAVIIKPEENGTDNGAIDQQIQARFTRAVSELQFLGYVKPSKTKPDHVTRLTFGYF